MITVPKWANLFAGHKKWWVIGGAVVIVAAVAGWSFYAWRDYSNQYISWHDILRQQVDKASVLKAETSDEKTKKIGSLKQIQQTAGQAKTQCDRYGILHWQQFIPEIAAGIARCEQMMAQIVEFGDNLAAVTGFLESEAKITAVIRTVANPANTQIDEASWKTTADRWDSAIKELQRLQLPQNLQPTQKTAIDKTTAVHAAWSALIAASEAKDRKKYETAVDQIGTAYSGFDQIIQVSDKTLKDLADKLDASYRRAFSKV